MPEEEIQGNKALISTREDARSIIGWQHERYHHLQSLAQGLLTAVLTATAVVTTIVTATKYNLPKLPSSSATYKTAASSFLLPISTEAARSIVLFNYGISILIGIASIVVLLAASHRLYTIISDHPLKTGISSKNYISIVSEDLFHHMHDEQGLDSIPSKFPEVIKNNQSQLEEADRRFTQGAVRVILAIGLAIIAIYQYYQCSTANITGLLIMDASILLPSQISSKVFEKGLGAKQEDLKKRKTGFFQELPFENNALSRWSVIEENRLESMLLIFVQLLSVLSLLSLVISYLNHLMGVSA